MISSSGDSLASNSSTLDPTGCYDTPSLVNHFTNLQSLMQQQAMQVPFISQSTKTSSPYAYQVNNSLPYQSFSSYILSNNQPFEVKFLSGYIKICAGCCQGYNSSSDGKNLPLPNDLCLVHKEQHMYYNIVNNRQQLSSLNNVHYHMDVSCKISFF